MKLLILAITTLAGFATAIPTVNAVPVTLEQRGYDCTVHTPCHPECAWDQYAIYDCTCNLPDCLRDSHRYYEREADLAKCCAKHGKKMGTR